LAESLLAGRENASAMLQGKVNQTKSNQIKPNQGEI
jgi:hypothetical protein